MKVIELDGILHEPFDVDEFEIYAGQRIVCSFTQFIVILLRVSDDVFHSRIF